MEKRSIPHKNYIIFTLISLVTILLIFFFVSWYKTNEQYRKEKIISSILQEVKKDEFENYLIENPNFILYLSKPTFENKNFEADFKEFIVSSDLKNNIVFINLYNVDNKFVNDLNNYFSSDCVDCNNKILIDKNILVFKNKEIIKILNKKQVKIEDISDFLQDFDD